MVEPVIVADFDALHGRVDKVVAVCDDPDAMAALEADIAAALGDSAQVSLSQTYYCDITHPKANKGDGIAALSEAIGIPFDRTPVRQARLAEAIAVLKGCFADGPFSFDGEHYTITDYDAYPKPVQRPHPPFLIGGGGRGGGRRHGWRRGVRG